MNCVASYQVKVASLASIWQNTRILMHWNMRSSFPWARNMPLRNLPYLLFSKLPHSFPGWNSLKLECRPMHMLSLGWKLQFTMEHCYINFCHANDPVHCSILLFFIFFLFFCVCVNSVSGSWDRRYFVIQHLYMKCWLCCRFLFGRKIVHLLKHQKIRSRYVSTPHIIDDNIASFWHRVMYVHTLDGIARDDIILIVMNTTALSGRTHQGSPMFIYWNWAQAADP